ncbi:hypothetical protein [Pediococcus pentosaceus]|uniref:hypothetical protein n=1 Tax=Pediococcus pentosaceus TaxID=1255 RepID=UPI000E04D325|nr:hypothetical protein [Pediococcus pentosaceus]AXR43543.1 hypothetical protein CKK51_05245 [Pediococcus pentosaceus]KAF0520032.1 hypothetical protein GBP31_01755 [Pediococcus pentosaceus]MBF7110725.1 hypothetical protein [Pediococcus pentosaceus]MBF7117697.1 hypothetical protein [Pediococcus pentosaceus]MCS8577990.1 hypothetical protein [Pediococcus pentosaceus]
MKKKVLVTEVNPGMIEERANVSLILENGDQLISEIKKAQQQIAELDKTLASIEHFIPIFHYSK